MHISTARDMLTNTRQSEVSAYDGIWGHTIYTQQIHWLSNLPLQLWQLNTSVERFSANHNQFYNNDHGKLTDSTRTNADAQSLANSDS